MSLQTALPASNESMYILLRFHKGLCREVKKKETYEIKTVPRPEGVIDGEVEQDSTFAADDNSIERTNLFSITQ